MNIRIILMAGLVGAPLTALAQTAAPAHDHHAMAEMPGMDMPAPHKHAPVKPKAKPAPTTAPASAAAPAPTETSDAAAAGPSVPPAPPPAHDHSAMAGMPMAAALKPEAAPAHDHGAKADDMAGMDMSEHHAMTMSGALGAYPGTRDAVGTAWQPDSATHSGLHVMAGPWMVMAHGEATLVYDNQGGKRGDTKTFVESFVMVSAQRSLGGGTLTLRGHGSLDPTMGKSGYPLLFQTGETANGVTPLIDRQHPHDLIDELSVTYSHPIATGASAFVYAAYPGDPALGPVVYLHRGSGMVSPETPIGHHWLDSTHVSFGVLTTGVVLGPVKLEGSTFKGREPDQHRWNFDPLKLDSYSVRATWNPTADLSMQVSRGWLHSPEQLEPDVSQTRTTASVTYNKPLKTGPWRTTLAWGRDQNRSPTTSRSTDAVLLESALSLGRHTVFGRAERADKDELFLPPSPLAGRAFTVSKLSLGYAYAIPVSAHYTVEFGGLVSAYGLPSALEPAYGSSPRSFMLFTRVRLN